MSRSTATRMLVTGAELLVWWAALSGLWMVLIGSVDTLEWVVGALAALFAACAAHEARRAASTR
ncbi:hypothetical protein ABTY53_14275 [Streptomyces noursei]|uniref:hypothetical protein n=1 Tax=Streptomyces noursei TaxID=1971 RepID=UPI00331E5676